MEDIEVIHGIHHGGYSVNRIYIMEDIEVIEYTSWRI